MIHFRNTHRCDLICHFFSALAVGSALSVLTRFAVLRPLASDLTGINAAKMRPRRRRPAVQLLAAVALAAVAGVGGVDGKQMATGQAACSLSEFSCSSPASVSSDVVRCVPSTRYCDGHRDCPDGSDEPQYCTREYIFHHSYVYYIRIIHKSGEYGGCVDILTLKLLLKMLNPPNTPWII